MRSAGRKMTSGNTFSACSIIASWIYESVPRGRKGPCCSVAPMEMTNVYFFDVSKSVVLIRSKNILVP